MPAFDPISCAVFISAFETTLCACRPRRFIPSARIWLRRIPEDIFTDVILNEAAEPLLDHVVNIIDAHSFLTAVILLIMVVLMRRPFIVK